ncbi:MAG: SPOR domain-containing protein [Prevotella sp.]|nr:SPOR domain-containing protein [Prevotella sp.]
MMKKKLIFCTLLVAALISGCKDNKSQQPDKGEQPQGQVNKGSADSKTEAEDVAASSTEEQTNGEMTSAPEASSSRPMVYSVSADGFLNIREQPNASSKILGRLLTDGKGAEYLGSTGQWHQVRYEGVVGFVHGNYARLEGLEKPQQAGRKVYYVVIGSYNDLNEAKNATRTLPDALDGSCIFRFTQDGKTVYRLCEGSYYSRATAQGQADGINQYLERDVWVFENDGVAPCVYQGVTPKGDAASVLPK